MPLSLSSSDRTKLIQEAHDKVKIWHEKGWLNIWPLGALSSRITRSQWEANLVAYLCASMHDVAASWKPIISAGAPGYHLSLASVFTHQTPMVFWPPVSASSARSARCELADLLVCVIDRTSSPGEGWAVLIQAKQSDSKSTSLVKGKSEGDQFDLLSIRPIFDLDSKPAPKDVDLSLLTPDRALMYGLNEPDSNPPFFPFRDCRWIIADGLASTAGTYKVSASTCLAPVLVNLLEGTIGWKFELPPPSSDWSYFSISPNRDDWSMLINYLLEQTFGKVSTLMGTASGNTQRGSDHSLFLKSSNSSLGFIFNDALRPSLDPLTWLSPESSQDDLSDWDILEYHPFDPESFIPPVTPETADNLDESGPISAVVFEITSSKAD